MIDDAVRHISNQNVSFWFRMIDDEVRYLLKIEVKHKGMIRLILFLEAKMEHEGPLSICCFIASNSEDKTFLLSLLSIRMIVGKYLDQHCNTDDSMVLPHFVLPADNITGLQLLVVIYLFSNKSWQRNMAN